VSDGPKLRGSIAADIVRKAASLNGRKLISRPNSSARGRREGIPHELTESSCNDPDREAGAAADNSQISVGGKARLHSSSQPGFTEMGHVDDKKRTILSAGCDNANATKTTGSRSLSAITVHYRFPGAPDNNYISFRKLVGDPVRSCFGNPE
jgi:hypothetical protein